MNVDEIKAIVKLMSDNDLTEFKIEAEQYNLCIKRGGTRVQAVQAGMVAPLMTATQLPQVQQVQQPSAAPPASSAAAQGGESKAASTIDSPLVGTFYRAPGPDATPFVKVGDKVTAETVVCIIEAMKVMNEVKAEKSGVIKDIVATDGTPVEYGQPLFVIE